MISPFLLAPIVAVFITKLGKLFTIYLSTKKIDLRTALRSGGMPSDHSSGIVSLATIIGLTEGFSSSIFALSALMSMLVLYDSVNVRYSSGRQGEAILKLIDKSGVEFDNLYIARGHTVIEMIVGSLVGLVVGVIVFITTQN